MADPRAHAHPEPHDPIDDGFETDPLAELTRIVSDRGAPPPAWTPPQTGGRYGRATPQAIASPRQPASARLPAMEPYVPPVEPPPPPLPVMEEPVYAPEPELAPAPAPTVAPEPVRPAPRPPVRPLFPTAAQAALDARARGAAPSATAQESYAFFSEQRARGASTRAWSDPESGRPASAAQPAGGAGQDPLAELARLASDPGLFERTFRRASQTPPPAAPQPAYDPVAEETSGLFDDLVADFERTGRQGREGGYLDDDDEDLARNQAPSATSTVDAYVPGDLESHAVPEVEETHPLRAEPRGGRDPYAGPGWAAEADPEPVHPVEPEDPYYDDAPVWRDPSGVEAVDTSRVDGDPRMPADLPVEEEAPRRSLFSGMGGVGIVVGVLVLALGGLFGYRLLHSTVTDGPPQVFASDDAPMKGPPPTSVAAEEDVPGKSIYDRVEGNKVDATSARLVERPAAPVDMLPGVGTPASDYAAGESGTPMEPRRVRTVVVRPDGTIMPGQTSESTAVPPRAADTLPEPVPETDRDAMASLATGIAGADSQAVPPESAPDATAAMSDTEITAPVEEPIGQTQGPLRLPERRPTPPPARTTVSAAPAAPQASAPSGGPMSLIPGTQSRPTQPPEDTVSAPAGSFMVQVTSQRTRDGALAAYQQLQRKFPSVLGGRAPSVQAANLGDKGTYYRVRVPGGSQAQAAQLCSRLKAAGGDCVVTRN